MRWFGSRAIRFSSLRVSCQQIGAARPKSQLAIEPKSTRLDRLFVVLADLVGVDREAGHACKLVQQVQYFGVDPRSLALTKSVERIEANLHPLEQSNRFEVIDGHAILERESGVVGTQRKAPVSCQDPQIKS